jgi:hypothetical protein
MGERVLRPLPSGDPLGSTLIVPTVTIFDGTENLRITSASSVATVLTIYIRLRLPTGVVEPMVLTHTPNSDRSIRTQDYPIGAGTLLNLLILPTTGSPVIGETFVQVMIIRGLNGATLPMGILAQDYTTARQPVAWPGGTLRRSTEGNGAIRSLGLHTQTGAALDVTVPTGARWRVIQMTARVNLTPSAGANRRALFEIVDGLTVQARWFLYSHVTQPIGSVWRYVFIPGITPFDQSALQVILLPVQPELLLRAGDFIRTTLDAYIDATEALFLDALVEEWLEFA